MAVSIIQVIAAVKSAVNLDVVAAAEKQIDEKLSDVNYLRTRRFGDDVSGIYYKVDVDMKLTEPEGDELKKRYLAAGYPAVETYTKNDRACVTIYVKRSKKMEQDYWQQHVTLGKHDVLNPSQQVTVDTFMERLNAAQDQKMKSTPAELNETHQEKMKATYDQYRTEVPKAP